MPNIDKTDKPVAPIAPKSATPGAAPPEEPAEAAFDAEEYERLLDMYDVSFRNFAEGEVVRGTVLRVSESEVIVDVGYKSEGVIALEEFRDETGQIAVKPGDSVDVLIEKTEDKEGYVVLSKEKVEKGLLRRRPDRLHAGAARHCQLVPAQSFAELIAYAKSNPGKLSYATAGPGTLQHIAAELMRAMTGTELLHVPYKGTGQIAPDLMASALPA